VKEGNKKYFGSSWKQVYYLKIYNNPREVYFQTFDLRSTFSIIQEGREKVCSAFLLHN
jgi:hypothetical protein